MNRHAPAVCFVLLLLAFGSEGVAVGPPPPELPEVEAWVADLSSTDFAVRKSAMRNLEGLGVAALPALRRVRARYADPDVRLRAVVAIAAIDRKLHGVVRRYVCPGGGVIAFAPSPDGRRMASGGNLVIHVWDVESGKELFQMKGHTGAVYSMDWSRDGKRILSGALDNTARLWDAETGKPIKTIGHQNGVLNAVFTLDGKKAITVGYNREVWLWDLETGKPAGSNADHTAGVRGLSIVPGGKLVATAGFDGTVRLLDIETCKQTLLCKGTHVGGAWFVAVSPDGKRVASSGNDGLVLLHDAETGELLKTFRGHAGGVHGVAYSPDGSRILSAGYDRTARVWDVASGKEVQRLYDHEDGVGCVAFLPGDRRAMTACFDRVVRLWSLRE